MQACCESPGLKLGLPICFFLVGLANTLPAPLLPLCAPAPTYGKLLPPIPKAAFELFGHLCRLQGLFDCQPECGNPFSSMRDFLNFSETKFLGGYLTPGGWGFSLPFHSFLFPSLPLGVNRSANSPDVRGDGIRQSHWPTCYRQSLRSVRLV